MKCSFSVPGKPQPKQRVRVPGGGKKARTPNETKAYERMVGLAALIARPRPWPSDEQYVVVIDIYFPDLRRRDGDNVMKAVFDGLNNVLWGDDDQVVDGRFTKRLDRQNPRADVRVSVFTGWPEEVEP